MPLTDEQLQEMRRRYAAVMGEKSERQHYANKLDPRRRCAVLALVMEYRAIPLGVVAKYYNLHKQTVSYIVTPNDKHYKSTRLKYQEMGHDAFIAEYLEPKALEATLSVVQGKRATMVLADPTIPDVYAKQRAGTHTLNGNDFVVEWRNEEGSEGKPGWIKGGWFYVDEQFGPVGPFNTSTLAYKQAQEDYQ